MKLESKHLAPYLPYKLSCLLSQSDFPKLLYMKTHNEKIIEDFVGIKNDKFLVGGNNIDVDDWLFKPILKPLSDFDKVEKIKLFVGLGKWCDMYDQFFSVWFDDICNIEKLILQCPYEIMQYFLLNHYDVFDLIKFDLAISIHDLE